MNIRLKLQVERDPTLPIMPVKINTGSALPITIKDLPDEYAGGTVTGVSVTVTNADGAAITGAATQDDNGDWCVLFAASNFATYGTVAYGVKITATVTSGETTYPVVFAGDFEVVQASASATPGDVSKTYQTLGGDEYLKTQVVDGVQHYTKLSMVYNEQLGWALHTDGDYVLENGEFVAYTEE